MRTVRGGATSSGDEGAQKTHRAKDSGWKTEPKEIGEERFNTGLMKERIGLNFAANSTRRKGSLLVAAANLLMVLSGGQY